MSKSRVILVCLLVGSLSTVTILACWCAFGTVRWIMTVPERMMVDSNFDEFATNLSNAFIDSYHVALRGTDTKIQAEIVAQFREAATNDPVAAEWIAAEYSEDLCLLTSSTDESIAEAAVELLEHLDFQTTAERAIAPSEPADL